MATQDKRHNESDGYRNHFLQKISEGRAELNKTISESKDENKVKVLLNIKKQFDYIFDTADKPSSSISDTEIYKSVSSNVKGEKKWPFIKSVVEDKEVKKMFGYEESATVKAYPVNKCEHPVVRLLLKLRFVKAHNAFPTNNQLPLYFCKQVIAEACKQISVDYTSVPPGTGYGRKKRILDGPKGKKQRMDPENLEVPDDLARMSRKQLLQHSIHFTKDLQLIISKFDIPLKNVSPYVKSYMEKPVTRAPVESSGRYQDPQFAFDGKDMKSTVTAEASHHCLPRDVEQVGNHVLDQDHLTPTRSCGGCLDTQFAFGSKGINSTVRAEEASRHSPKDLEQEIPIMDWANIPLIDRPNPRHVEYKTSISTQPDFTNANGQQHGDFTHDLHIDRELSDTISAHLEPENFPEFDIQAIFPARTVTTDSSGTVRWEELSAINAITTLDDERWSSSNTSSLTLSINGIIIKTPDDYINVKFLFGLNAMLIDSYGQPVPMDEHGLTWLGAQQQGVTYYAILADPSGQPVVGEGKFTVLPLQQAAAMYH